jgi:hypothetical protein
MSVNSTETSAEPPLLTTSEVWHYMAEFYSGAGRGYNGRDIRRKGEAMRRGGLIIALYLIVGIIVAIAQDYFENLGNVNSILELLVAILLWPLILFGVDINIGGGGGGGNGGGS